MPASLTEQLLPAGAATGGGYDADVLPLGLNTEGADGGGPLAYLNGDERSGASPNGKPSLTIDQAGKWLTEGDSRVLSNIQGEGGWGQMGQAFTVTYAYRASAPLSMPSDTEGFSRFNASQIQQAELALKGWSDVARISFQRVDGGDGYSDNAQILLANYSSGSAGAAAFANLPGFRAEAGDVWVNSTLSYNANPQIGNYGAQVLVHELGHAIGLNHPGAYDADANTTFTYDSDAEYYEDSRQYTVMSYFSSSNTGANYQGLYAAAPQLDDIRAAQVEYGANMSTRTGDTVYGFHATADRPWFIADGSSDKLIFAVWDAGGNDTFDFSGYFNNQVIDLRAGNFSNVGGLTGNVAIAQGVNIENALSGSGADVIHGNAGDNRIFGGAGSDTIDGGTGGYNYMRGEDGNDVMNGGADFDDIQGNTGNDTEHGAGGNDWVVGGQNNDVLFGDDGNDVLNGNLGNDTIDGGTGGDTVRGGQGDDVITGGSGSDWLSGDLGNDTLTGGTGGDIFHGFAGIGVDRITDFNYAEGDRVVLDPGTAYSFAQVGADTVVTITGGGQMVLAGVQLNSLASGWIV